MNKETGLNPMLMDIKVGIEVVSLAGKRNAGIKGVITGLVLGPDNTASGVKICVDYDEDNMDCLIFEKDELGFFIESRNTPLFFTIEGIPVCPHCYEPLENIVETREISLKWSFNDGEYSEDLDSDSTGKCCDLCGQEIDNDDLAIFEL